MGLLWEWNVVLIVIANRPNIPFPDKPSHKTLPSLWLHLPPCSPTFGISPLLSVSGICHCTLTSVPLYILYSPLELPHHQHISVYHLCALNFTSPVKLSLKPSGWSDYIFLWANTVSWIYSCRGTWVPALHTAPSYELLQEHVYVSFIFIFQHLWWLKGLHLAGILYVTSQSCLKFNKNFLP